MKKLKYSLIFLVILLAAACNTTKYVADNEFLLNKVKIKSDIKVISSEDLLTYIRQTPNSEVFGLFKMQLALYNWSGKDSTKWINRWLKKIGDEPVIYNSQLTTITQLELKKLYANKGYINAEVTSEISNPKKKQINLEYKIKSNQPYKLRGYSVNIQQKDLYEIAADTSQCLIKTGKLFDSDKLNDERTRITNKFRQSGYYNFNKDFLHYFADSTLNSHQIDAVLELNDNLKTAKDSVQQRVFRQYTINKVHFYSETDKSLDQPDDIIRLDTATVGNYEIIYEKNQNIRPSVLIEKTHIIPQNLYSDLDVERTYSSLNALSAIKYMNISFREVDENKLDCYIILSPNKLQSISTDVEGTYSAGYWGLGGNINYAHRNAFKGSETINIKGRVAYEYQGAGQNAIELGGDIGIKFPTFLLPFADTNLKRKVSASTQVNTTFSYRNRPNEYTGIITGAGFEYTWSEKTQIKHNFDVLDISYVYYPWISPEYRNQYLTGSNNFIYNFQDHLIMKTGYSGSYSTYNPTQPLRNYIAMSYGIETAGNLLYGIDKLLNVHVDSVGAYKVFGIRYSQYLKTDFNISHHQILDPNNRLVYHFGVGIAVPYGNAENIPFEKRYFSGGANSVRGWTAYQLGPGTYKSPGNYVDYNTQMGDIKIDMNMEYRSKLFWKLDGALFLDAGNVWTIKNYENQPGGVFRFKEFANQFGVAYGLGIRADFSFFVIRVDLGMKLYNPALSRTERWRTSPKIDDAALNLAIGYPF